MTEDERIRQKRRRHEDQAAEPNSEVEDQAEPMIEELAAVTSEVEDQAE